jgi:hypothetical protein
MHRPSDQFPEGVALPDEGRVAEKAEDGHLSNLQILARDPYMIELVNVISPDDALLGFPKESAYESCGEKLQ